MKAVRVYIATTGVVFCLIVVAHILRLATEGPRLAREPSFILTTAIVVGLAVWAGVLLLKQGRS